MQRGERAARQASRGTKQLARRGASQASASPPPPPPSLYLLLLFPQTLFLGSFRSLSASGSPSFIATVLGTGLSRR